MFEPDPTQPESKNTGAEGWERQTLERLLFAQLEEQKSQKRWRNFFRLSWLILIIAFVWLGIEREGALPDTHSPHTAVIQIKGEIGSGSETDAKEMLSALRDAFEDEQAQAVVLRINSPGGSPVHAGLINDEIKRLKIKHQKPVYAVVEETCASAAYYIAVAADSIYADKASIVGSIGVLMDGFGFTGLMGKLGVERRLFTAGENKGLLDPFSPVNPAQREHAQKLLNQIHQQFIGVVKEGRGDRLKETPGLFSGLFWTGEQAVQLGLIDGLSSVDQLARDVIKAEDLIDYTPHEGVAERLAKRFGAALGSGAIEALKSSAVLK
jgi:protease-4